MFARVTSVSSSVSKFALLYPCTGNILVRINPVKVLLFLPSENIYTFIIITQRYKQSVWLFQPPTHATFQAKENFYKRSITNTFPCAVLFAFEVILKASESLKLLILLRGPLFFRRNFLNIGTTL